MPLKPVSGKIYSQDLNDNFSYLDTKKLAVTDIDKSKGLIDQSYLSPQLLAQIAGTAGIYQMIQGLTGTNDKLADGAVDERVFSFYKIGKNLFDKAKVVSGYEVKTTDGTLVANVNYSTSAFIRVKPNTTYSRSKAYNYALYNANLTYISGAVGTRQITTTADTRWIRVSMANTDIDIYQLEEGSSETTFEPYYFTYDLNKAQASFTKAFIEKYFEASSISVDKTSFAQEVKQVSTVNLNVGMVVNDADGTLMGSGNPPLYDTTDFLPVQENSTFEISNTRRIGFYNATKTFIGVFDPGSLANDVQYTTPANTAYQRISFATGKVPYLIPITSNGHEIIMPNLRITPEQIKGLQTNQFLAYLPKEIYVAVGRTIELYNRQVSWCGNINNYHFKWSCQIGKAMKRKFSVTGAADKIGQYPLTLTVFDNDMNQIWQKTTQLKIVSNVISTTKNVLVIADSLWNTTTNPKPTYTELRNLSNNKLNFVGTRGLVTGEMHEARSGFSAADYLEGTEYTYENEGIQPFWDGTRFNWDYYKTQKGINPDIVIVALGTNDAALDPTENANNIKKIVDSIRQDDPNIPIYPINTLYRGDQDGIGNQVSSDGYAVNQGQWKLQEDRKIFNLMVRLDDLLSDYSNLHFIPVALTHDSEYNFKGKNPVPVNPRSTITEWEDFEATHPSQRDSGYLQFADTTFSTLAGTITS